MTRPNIAFVGKAGSGKTTAAELLAKYWDYERMSFAQPLKQAAMGLWGPSAATDRDKLQKLGIYIRAIEENTFVDLTVERMEMANGPITVDDCRFPNEYQRLAEEEFIFVRISAPKALRIVRLQHNGKLQDEAQLEHESEIALDDRRTDYVIANDGTPKELLDAVTMILNKEAARV